MKVIVMYVYPIFGGSHEELAARFVASYRKHPPSTKHELLIVSNGGDPTPAMWRTFDGVPCSFLVHDDTGYDIGAYIKAASTVPCDLMVFFGGSTYIRHPRWLERMVESYQKHGRALYGVMGNQGDARVKVWPHVRTTGFWCPPDLIKEYPHTVTSATESRYAFEHGEHGLTSWVRAQGLKVWIVTPTDETPLEICDSIPNTFHQGDQSALLVGDRLTCEPYWRTP